MKYKILIVLIISLLFSCSTNQIVLENPSVSQNSEISSDNNKKLISEKENLIENYKASETKKFDLINTELHIRFDYKHKQAFGFAVITLKPHFYPSDTLVLDAQKFDIKSIELKNKNSIKSLSYIYKNDKIKIDLDRVYTKYDTVKIVIDYVANPEKVKSGGSWAIHDNKGLYFINSDTDNPQIWTQGETQSNSCWFPTIDSPNQKMSQDFYITVKNDFLSLSNGKLVSSIPNADGTRTDYWQQTKAHAPYLAMIAVGKFSLIKDYWRNIPLTVYTEKGKEEKTKQVFGKTAKMIEFFSRKLNYDFPWDKYSQIIVKDFVSGAMENTGAVTFGTYVLTFKNENQRIEYESVVAHELSHHWFGDLVTCESWANLPLNESFATYFEYLWIEHEYGRFIADAHLENDYLNYNFERFFKNKDLIRFYYKHRDDMFDGHSYQKGGLILHMLRYTVGDEAFWKALHLYLKKNEYQSVEIHNLRLAFEEVTGEDMNWFFNEWFLNKGIPELNITYDYSQNEKTASVKIEQIQNLKIAPLYKIPTSVDICFQDTVIRKKITIAKQSQIFQFKVKEKPLFMNFDPENALLCKKTENYTLQEYIYILDKASLYADLDEAFKKLQNNKSHQQNVIYLKLMKHPYSKFRYKATAAFDIGIEQDENLINQYKKELKYLIENDSSSKIRGLAKKRLALFE